MAENDKPNTASYFSNELKSQLMYLNALDKKMYDLNYENRKKVEEIVLKYKDNTSEFEAPMFARLNQINKLFGCVANDLQMTICKIENCIHIMTVGFGLSLGEIDLTDEEKKQIEFIISNQQSCLFCFASNDKGEQTIKMKDDKLYEVIREKSYKETPTEQNGLRQLFNIYYTNYNKEKEAEDKARKEEERRKKKEEEHLKHEEEIKKIMNGKKGVTEEKQDTEG